MQMHYLGDSVFAGMEELMVDMTDDPKAEYLLVGLQILDASGQRPIRAGADISFG